MRVNSAHCGRRKSVDLGAARTGMASREDPILSTLLWARDAKSELQMRDVQALLEDSVDQAYLNEWVLKLGLDPMLAAVQK
ncbi:hypothetical protein B1A_16610 [mine drainage metagenome]|uniref:Uncharacterized protein n=1 Tax=mine drainage metagenome TaxID=410659 RepID=T1AGB5_9ZZZZ